MHFLCLHGIGTNSKVFETQTAAIRADLGDGHTYDFVEGSVPWPKAPELGDLFSDNEEYFAYFDPSNPSSLRQAIADLESYIQTNGPFDCLLAFSQGASLSGTLLLGKGPLDAMGFKCAIFLAAGLPFCAEALKRNEMLQLDKTSDLRISLPTAHIWAANDPLGPISSALDALCCPQVRHVYIHNEGHVVPNRRSPETFRAAVNVIRRSLWEIEPL